MLYLQMFLTTSFGLLLALSIFLIVKVAINYWAFAPILEGHRNNLDIIGTLDLLPLALPDDFLYVWISSLLVTVILVSIHLYYFLPLRSSTAPSELLQS
jgi:hypothetical protein